MRLEWPGIFAASAMRFTIATYNIHKGFPQFTRRMVIHELRERLHGLSADILFLQEVLGTHDRHQHRHREWPGKSQHEFIADANWHEVAYGKNAIYRDGHHGNALLSRFRSSAQENCDISAHLFESRGLLHCEIKLGRAHAGAALHQRAPRACSSADGSGRSRRWSSGFSDEVPKEAPLIIAGDFNDWRSKGDRHADRRRSGSLRCSRKCAAARRGRFPSALPVFRLDRIYARGLAILDAHVHYTFKGQRRMSDHAALAATFEIVSRRSR